MSKRERLFWFLLSFLLFLSHFTIPDRVKAVSRETEMYLNIFHEALKFIRMDYVEEVKEADLFKGAIRGVLSSLGDPHSRFLDEDEFKEHKEETRGSYGGIGIEVTYRNGSILVISPIDGTPAKKAGILPGDRIVEIDGKQTRKMTIPDAIKIMRGKIGSSVKIKIKRKGHDELLDFSFVRKLIQIHYIKSEYISKQKIGYIRLTQFMGFENTLEEFQKTLHSLLKKGARSFIIDLRMNPGGLLQMATEISDLFLPEGKVIVSVRGRGGKLIQVSKSSSGDKTLEKIPLLVLIDKGSASASEIFAGAIKDNKRGLILGEKSFGKGSVQNIYSLPHDTGLALTIQKYYTPSEKSIHGIGIQPDVVVESLKPRDFEKKALIKLFKSSFIETFVKKHPDGYNRKNRQRFLKELNRMSIHLSREIALSLLKKEYNLNHETVFDLEFDPQLRKAIQILGKKKMIGLGIETSCDETSLSLVEDGKKLLGLKIFSQIALHKKFKGVVPEIASRAHLEKINLLFEELKEETFLKPESLSYVAVTSRPGLMGSLMIGAQFARCLSLVHSIPIITVDHLEAHLAAIYLENKEPLFPFLGVLLSGGNSSIYLVKNFGEMDLLGDTMDDALGEAFDKVSMILGLSYPGGPEIERRAGEYVPLNDEKRLFPELLKDLPVNKIQFSYSGIKTGVLYYSRKVSLKEREISKICYHFQNTAFQLVEKNIKRAVKKTGIRRVVAAGGVLANDTLKARLKKLAGKENIQISYPERKVLCTDNGAMVASLGYYLFQKQKIDKIDFKVSPNRQIYT